MLGYNITNATYLSSAYFQCSGLGNICLFPDNDANTGIMFDGPDTMSIHTGGSQAILVNSQQQVGLLMTPNQRLTVNGSGNFTGNVSLSGTGTCFYLPSGGRLCGNSTCSTMYSPNGLTVMQSCN
jgi:hypothetical protein